MTSAHHIGSLNEKALHADLKEWYRQSGDQLEVKVDGFFIDIVRGDLLIEIQTRNFSALKRKLLRLTEQHPVRLVYPVACEKWIIKQDADGQKISRRKSPKRATPLHLFTELVSFPELMSHPNFSLDVLSVQEEEVRRHDPKLNWRRRGWTTHERRLLTVQEQCVFVTPQDCGALLPDTIQEPFTTKELAHALDCPRWLIQKMVYCLHRMDVLTKIGKQGNAWLYCRNPQEQEIDE